MADKISFANLQLKTGITPTTAPNALGLNDLGTTTGTAARVLAAIVGDGDKTLETGESGYVIGGAGSSNAVTGLATLNTAADPVTITLNGRIGAGTVGSLAATALGFNNTWGFGIDNGPDGNNRLLNLGDALTFTTNPVSGVPQQVTGITFAVDRNGATTATEVAFDFDGDVLKSGSYAATANAANADTALRLANVPAGAVIAVDFLGHHLTVNGVERTGTDIDTFFAIYERSPKNAVTIGSITSNGFSVRDLVIDRAAYDGPAPNAAPSVSLTPVQTVIADTADLTGGVLVANIVIADDASGRNDLSLTGADAGMFEIKNGGLYLKAGSALHAASNPTLDVSVVVDDRTVGSTPDSSAALSVAVTASAANRISFADVQLKTGVTPLTAPNALTSADLGTTTGVANRALVAITGNGDKALSNGETGYVIGGAASGNDVPNLATLDTAADPVTITMHGRIDTATVGALAATALDFNNTWGFGIDNGPDSNGRLLNVGDALSFTTNAVGGMPQQITGFTFTVDRNAGTTATEVAFDFDGDVLKSGSYTATTNAANADAALRLANVPAGAVIAIDFLGHHLSVNGTEQTGANIDAFFAAYERSPKNIVTVGSITSNGFSVRDLVIDRAAYDAPAPNAAPSVSLTPVQTVIVDTADLTGGVLVANIVITDDASGRNDLSLTGADAGMFEIKDGGLYLKAGSALHAASNPTLDVNVVVDDRTVGSTPDSTAAFSVAVTASVANRISFADVQLKTGVTPTTAPNALTSADIGTTTSIANRALVAITGNGDKALSNGETGYVIGGAGTSNAVANLATLDTADDPVTVTLHGRTSAGAVGTLAATALGFTNTWGFGVDNGPDANNRLLNAGDALTFALNPVAGVAQQLTAISFAVDRNGATTATEVDLDFDGNVLKTGSYAASANAANASAALRLTGVPANAVISIDFVGHHLSINGAEQTGASIDAFFAAYEASPRNAVTIGSIAADGFSVRDLVIDRATPSQPVGPVVDTDSAANTVAENAAAGTVIGVTAHAADPNATDTVSYTVSDGRFNVDANGVVTVAQGAAFDAETEQTITLHVTAKSTDGSSSAADFVVQVGDVNEFATGPVGDTDAAENTVATSAVNGTAVGITALAQDQDRTTNAITYSLDDASGAFGIDAATGKVTVADAGKLTAGSHTITVHATSADASTSAQTFTVNVTSATNAAPTAVALAGIVAGVDEAAASAATKVADIVVTDDALGSNAVTLGGADAAAFQVITNATGGTELWLRAGQTLDWETKSSLDVTVTVADATLPGSTPVTTALSLPVNNVAEHYGSITLDGTVGEWLPTMRLDGPTTGAPGFAVYGAVQAGAFLLGVSSDSLAIGPGTTLWLDTDLNNGTGFQVYGWAVGAEYNIHFDADGHARLYTGNSGEAFVANLDYGLSADGRTVEIALPQSLVQGKHSLDLAMWVNNEAAHLPGDFGQAYRLGDMPTVAITPVLTELRENADISQPIKVADIAVTAPNATGNYSFVLTGANAGFFDWVKTATGGELYLKAGADIDHEHYDHLEVTVGVDDPTIGTLGSVENSQNYSLAIGDVVETQGPITLDGVFSTGEWGDSTRLDIPSNGATGFAVYGTYASQSSTFVLGIQTDGRPIDLNSTIWVNADTNAATGYKVFGSEGVEYKVEFAAGGVPALYAVDATTGATTLVAQNLDYFFNANHSTLEIALPSSLVGGSHHASFYIDVNEQVFLPKFLTLPGYRVDDKGPLLPQDPGMRIAIVYSDTSADHYFSKTAYGQLFMAAQNQAMQAGIPFDILSEADLTSMAGLMKDGKIAYDAIVFPGMQYVQSGLLDQITQTLTTASHDYHIGLIAMGDFLTNTELGVVPDGVYARMQSLLGVTFAGTQSAGGTTNVVEVQAENGSHPVTEHYTANEVVGDYKLNGYSYFQDVTGTGQTVFSQSLNGGAENAAVIATTAGGRNVHFATDAVFGNNNILQDAINWSARGNAPDVGLDMTRGSSLFYSRNDLDQSQEHFDMAGQGSVPPIYDTLLPILQQWYHDFNFVGSYYANIGADVSFDVDRWTDWNLTAPYYQAMAAMGNEIGTHSYTHPEDTNYLLKESFSAAEWQAWLDHMGPEVPSSIKNQISALGAEQTQAMLTSLLQATDPATHLNADTIVYGLSDLERAILTGSYRFQFEYSKEILQQHLQQFGITLTGAAVPGAPELATTSTEIMKYVQYLTGGYTGIGAGYPGAFGFIDPAHTDQVYFAPNIPFDFSLVEFQHMTADEAGAAWAAAYDSIVSHGGAPIIHFPWHDYAPMNWDTTNGTGPGNGPGYTLAMFTNFIQHAYQQGTEFVTGADLAQRIESFVATKVEITQVGSQIVAQVTGTDTGKFALDVDTTQVIASVDNWYAFDGKKVFLPKNGGTFVINLGNQAADVTHITKLPMRAELVTVNGDGSDLTYSLNGRGDVVVDVKSGGGIVAGGADDASMTGQKLTLTHAALGAHAGSVDWVSGGATLAGTDGDDFLFGSSSGTLVYGGHGHDMMTGGGGADTFAFASGDGNDSVRDFNLAEDRLELVHSGFASAAAALASFANTTSGATLTLSPTDHLTLSNITVAQLTVNHLVLTDTLVG